MVNVGNNRILVVDDEIDMRNGLQKILSRKGYAVDTAEGGLRAVEKMKQTSFQVVIADLKMPQMDGIEVLRRAKDLNRTIAVIIITGYGTVTSAVESMRLGAFDYITKPFKPDDITIIVERALKTERLLPEEEPRETLLPKVTPKSRQIITVDVKKCYACLTCVVECAYARLGLPKHVPISQVLSASGVSVEAAGDLAVPLRCMQCEDAPCITVCPTGALYRDSLDDPVLIDQNLCIGCKSCMLACPIGAISLDPEGKAVQKCDMCIARLKKGQLPVCVTSCPTEATQLTTLDEVTTRARETSASVLAEVLKAKQQK
ncbi:MAG: response regulator [Planctomycetota bacterium]|jgi:Fe-S-cluster-containing dehydrogenase component